MMSQISVIIPTKDRETNLISTLNKLIESDSDKRFDILVINDSVKPIHLPDAWSNRVKVHRNKGRGVASARNTGAELCNTEWLWFLDDDMWVNLELADRVKHHVYSGMTAVYNFNWVYPPELQAEILGTSFGRFLTSIGFTTMKGWSRGLPWKEKEVFPTLNLAGATLLIPKSVYASVNGYDASFPLAGFEDYDFSSRLIKASIPCFIDTTVLAYHHEVNKTVLRGFLERTRNNAITRAHAVKIGYGDQAIRYSFGVRMLYFLASPFMNTLIRILEKWPNKISWDHYYSFFCHRLIGYYAYLGYSGEMKKKTG